MNPNVRALNAGPTQLQIDSAGHQLDPGAWAEVDPNDPITARHLEAGRLMREQEQPKAEPKKASRKDGEEE